MTDGRPLAGGAALPAGLVVAGLMVAGLMVAATEIVGGDVVGEDVAEAGGVPAIEVVVNSDATVMTEVLEGVESDTDRPSPSEPVATMTPITARAEMATAATDCRRRAWRAEVTCAGPSMSEQHSRARRVPRPVAPERDVDRSVFWPERDEAPPTTRTRVIDGASRTAVQSVLDQIM